MSSTERCGSFLRPGFPRHRALLSQGLSWALAPAYTPCSLADWNHLAEWLGIRTSTLKVVTSAWQYSLEFEGANTTTAVESPIAAMT